MEYEIEYSNKALRQLAALPRPVADKILRKIERLGEDMVGDVKKFSNHSPEYRLRVGDYRYCSTWKELSLWYRQLEAGRRAIDHAPI